MTVISDSLIPALKNYLSVLKTLQQAFKQIEVEATNIATAANKIEREKRAVLMFKKMKGAAKRVTEASMGLLTFYETVHSRLKALE